MNKWSEKTTLEKVATVIAGIALSVWLVFEYLQRNSSVACAEMGSCIAIGIVCICEAIDYWRVKRAFSYVAIAGAVCLATALVFLAL